MGSARSLKHRRERMEPEMSIEHAEALVASAATASTTVDAADLPRELLEKTEAQHRHLVELAASLVDSGMSEAAIEAVLRKAIASYQHELVKAVVHLSGGPRRG